MIGLAVWLYVHFVQICPSEADVMHVPADFIACAALWACLVGCKKGLSAWRCVDFGRFFGARLAGCRAAGSYLANDVISA